MTRQSNCCGFGFCPVCRGALPVHRHPEPPIAPLPAKPMRVQCSERTSHQSSDIGQDR